MSKIKQHIFSLSIFVFVLSTFSLLLYRESIAQEPICVVTIVKEADGIEGIDFNFLSVVGPNITPFILTSGIPQENGFQTSVIVTYTELDTPGWALADVACDSNDGVSITSVDNGVTIECLSPGGEAECVWTNIRLRNIPTLSEWAMISAAAGLGLVGLFFALKHRKAQMDT